MAEEATEKSLISTGTATEQQDKAKVHGKIAEIDKSPDEIINRLPPNSLTRRLFPTAIAKHLQQYELDTIVIETDFRKNVLQVARNAQLQAVEEMYQDFLQKGKARVQTDRQKVFFELLQEARKHTEQQISIFLKDVDEAYMRLESIKHEKLAKK